MEASFLSPSASLLGISSNRAYDAWKLQKPSMSMYELSFIHIHGKPRSRRRRKEGFVFCGKILEVEEKTVEREGYGLFKKQSRGSPFPFGATFKENGVNFAIHSSAATSVSLCLFTPSDLQLVLPP